MIYSEPLAALRPAAHPSLAVRSWRHLLEVRLGALREGVIGLLPRCLTSLVLERQWSISGRHYERTLRAWLARLDARRPDVEAVLARGRSSVAGRLAAARWRIFFLACAELFGFRGGAEWGVAHYLLRPAAAGAASLDGPPSSSARR